MYNVWGVQVKLFTVYMREVLVRLRTMYMQGVIMRFYTLHDEHGILVRLCAVSMWRGAVSTEDSLRQEHLH